MTAKKVQPKNPDTETTKTDTSPETDRKTQYARGGMRKLARKNSALKGHG